MSQALMPMSGIQPISTAKGKALHPIPEDEYPDFAIPLARAVAAGKVDRGIALCGSGVEASICANKIAGVCAGLIHDVFSAHQGVEDDDMNVFSLGGNVIGTALAWELIQTFLRARFSLSLIHISIPDLENPLHSEIRLPRWPQFWSSNSGEEAFNRLEVYRAENPAGHRWPNARSEGRHLAFGPETVVRTSGNTGY